MDDKMDDFLEDVLTDFEALNVSASGTAAALKSSSAGEQPTRPDISRSSGEASSSCAAPTSQKKPLAFDPMRGGRKRSTSTTPASTSSSSHPVPVASRSKKGMTDPGGGLPAGLGGDDLGALAELLGGSSGPGMPALAPELEQLAAQLSKLVAEVGDGSLDGHASPSPPSSSTPMSSTVRALAERTQHSMAQQPDLPGLPDPPMTGFPLGGLPMGGGLNGLLPDLKGIEGAGLNQLVDSILQHLLSKDVLYEPIKEIGTCYPPWLERNRDTLPPNELERFEKQYSYIQQICHVYENDPDNFTELVQLMQQMQACGDPPDEVANQLSAGILGAQEEEGSAEGRDASVPSVEELQHELNKCPVQ